MTNYFTHIKLSFRKLAALALTSAFLMSGALAVSPGSAEAAKHPPKKPNACKKWAWDACNILRCVQR